MQITRTRVVTTQQTKTIDATCGGCCFFDSAAQACHQGPPGPGTVGWPQVDAADWCGQFEPKQPA